MQHSTKREGAEATNKKHNKMANLRNASINSARVLLVLGLTIALTATMTAAGNDADDDHHQSSSSSSWTTTTTTEGTETGTTTKDIPVLEPGNEGADNDDGEGGGGGEKVRQLKFGETIKLDDIGPIIVNEDCSMRRIANWHSLTQREKNGAQRRIAARNKGRMDHCRKLEDRGELRRPLDVHDDFAPSARNPAAHIDEAGGGHRPSPTVFSLFHPFICTCFTRRHLFYSTTLVLLGTCFTRHVFYST